MVRNARPHLLVGFAESLAAPESIWSLADAGFRVTAFTRRGARPPIRRFSEIEVVEVDSPAHDWRACLSQISDFASVLEVSALMPFDDEALWLCARHADESNAPVIGPTGEQAEFALDKRLQFARAQEAGLNVPQTVEFDSIDALMSRGSSLPFPVVLKRARAINIVGSRLTHVPTSICADERELEQLRGRYGDGHAILVQPWIDGVGEGVFGLMSGGRLVAVSGHRRVRMVDPHGSGSSACVPSTPESAVVTSIERMLTAVDWRGLFMVELLRQGSTIWFTEFNGRTWGSTALARRVGLEYPAWAARECLLGESEIKVPSGYPGITCRHLGFEIAHLLAVMKGPRSAAIRFPSRLRTLRDVARIRRTDEWYNLRPGCRSVFVDDTFQTALTPVRQAMRRWISRERQ